jgi:hypothetical protein
VDLGAPGVGILSTLPGSAYVSWNGTSMATPHVSGAAALMWSLRLGATHLQIKKKILSSVDPVASLAGKTVTGGRLNLYRAVSNQPPVIESSAWASPNPVVLSENTTTAFVIATDPDDDPLTYVWSGPSDVTSDVTFDDSTAATTGVTLPATAGSYSLQVIVSDGTHSTASKVTVNVIDGSTLPPAAPSGLSATAISKSQVNLKWTDNASNETDFCIERRIGATGAYTQIETVGANVTTWSDTGLSAKTKYSYRVRAQNANGYSAYSNTVNVTTPRR